MASVIADNHNYFSEIDWLPFIELRLGDNGLWSATYLAMEDNSLIEERNVVALPSAVKGSSLSCPPVRIKARWSKGIIVCRGQAKLNANGTTVVLGEVNLVVEGDKGSIEEAKIVVSDLVTRRLNESLDMAILNTPFIHADSMTEHQKQSYLAQQNEYEDCVPLWARYALAVLSVGVLGAALKALGVI